MKKKKLNWAEKERQDRLRRRLKATGEIDTLQYKLIEKGFYEVHAWTWADKISFQGEMCGGLLKEFIKLVLKEGGKVERVKHTLIEKEAKEEVKKLSARLARINKNVRRATRLLKLESNRLFD